MNIEVVATFIGFIGVIVQWIILRKLKAGKKDNLMATFILLAGASLYLAILMHVPMPSLNQLIGQMLGPLYKPVAHWVMEGNSSG